MAHSKEAWAEAKFLFELDNSLNDIHAKTGIDRTAVSKKAKKEGWEKGKNQQLKSEIVRFEKEKSTLEAKKSTLVEKVSTLNDFEITMLDGIVEKETDSKSLIFSTQALAIIRNNQILTSNKKTVMLKVQQFSSEGVRQGENYEPFEVPLSSSDIKECVDSTHRAGQSLGVIEQFAPKNDVKLAVQNNTQYMSETEVMKAVANSLPD